MTQMAIGLIGIIVTLMILYVIGRLFVKLGKVVDNRSGIQDDGYYLVYGISSLVFFMVVIIVLFSCVYGVYTIGDMIMTALGLKG